MNPPPPKEDVGGLTQVYRAPVWLQATAVFLLVAGYCFTWLVVIMTIANL